MYDIFIVKTEVIIYTKAEVQNAYTIFLYIYFFFINSESFNPLVMNSKATQVLI